MLQLGNVVGKRRRHLSLAAVEREASERGGRGLAEKVQLLEKEQTFWQNWI